MKSRASTVSFLILAIGFALGFAFHDWNNSTVEAQGPFRGAEICFQVEGPTGPRIRVAATNLGNNHYLLAGRVEEPSDPTFIEPIFGNLEIKAGKVHMSFVSSRSATGMPDDTTSGGFINNVVLDIGTLSGTVQTFGIEHDSANGMTGLDHSAPVQISRINCP